MFEFKICKLDEIEAGELHSFDVEGMQLPVLVFWHDGEIVAGSGMCPHEDVELVHGELDGDQLICGAHGYAFDVKSGACAHEARLCWKRYKTRIEHGVLFVSPF